MVHKVQENVILPGCTSASQFAADGAAVWSECSRRALSTTLKAPGGVDVVIDRWT